MRSNTRLALVAAPIIVVLAGMVVLLARAPDRATRAEFAGSARCARCHAAEYAAWDSSHHAMAMQPAQPSTVLGAFDGSRFVQNGVTSTFLERGGKYVVNTAGADGKNRDFEVRYTFGVWPLQQYLLAFPRGRLQALSVAWDARTAANGGQRWFSLDAGTDSGAPRWTGPAYNWNYMCADCHSTAVRKGYDAETDAYNTSWAEVTVGCEACHGPGSEHLKWAAAPAWERRLFWRDDGLPAQLTERRGAQWVMDPAASIAHRTIVKTTDREIDACAQCHARRVHIADGYAAGAPLLDFYIPELLDGDLYYPDGQQRDEDYNYASFRQSKMYRAGVTCSDCHDPHSARTRRPGNALCTQCHRASTYDTSAHHFHEAGTSGAQCVSCHMPSTTYMQLQPRPDHAMGIPRPDLSVSLGVPNACTRCHTDRDAAWAADTLPAWYGTRFPPRDDRRFAQAFADDDRNAAGPGDSLAAVAADATEPAIVRASALSRLSRYPGPVALNKAGASVRDADPLVRLAALQILAGASEPQRLSLVSPLLADPVRAVRQGAAFVLAPIADSIPTSAARKAFAVAAAEFVSSQRYNADQPANRVSLGAFFTQLGQFDSATVEFRAALRLAPGYAESYPGMAAQWRAQGQDRAADALMRALPPASPQTRRDP
jgi:predicted CXXCH cytochrome family protein